MEQTLSQTPQKNRNSVGFTFFGEAWPRPCFAAIHLTIWNLLAPEPARPELSVSFYREQIPLLPPHSVQRFQPERPPVAHPTAGPHEVMCEAWAP